MSQQQNNREKDSRPPFQRGDDAEDQERRLASNEEGSSSFPTTAAEAATSTRSRPESETEPPPDSPRQKVDSSQTSEASELLSAQAQLGLGPVTQACTVASNGKPLPDAKGNDHPLASAMEPHFTRTPRAATRKELQLAPAMEIPYDSDAVAVENQNKPSPNGRTTLQLMPPLPAPSQSEIEQCTGQGHASSFVENVPIALLDPQDSPGAYRVRGVFGGGSDDDDDEEFMCGSGSSVERTQDSPALLVSGEAVDEPVEATAAPPKQRWWSKRRIIFSFPLVVALVVVGAVTAVIVALIPDDDKIVVVTNAPTEEPTMAPPSWVQVGADIHGKPEDDAVGYSLDLSANGTSVAVAAAGGSGPGYVQVYQASGDEWIKRGQDIVGVDPFDAFGTSLALSADGIVVAAGGPYHNGNIEGHVQIYRLVEGNWTQIGQDINGKASRDYFGISLSISADGTVVAIGAHQRTAPDDSPGYVQVYKLVEDQWTQLGQDINGEGNVDWFGCSVSLSASGTTLVVGAPFNSNDSGTSSGHVRIYRWMEGAWQQLGHDIDGEAAYDNFGMSVSLSSNGTFVAVGAYGNDGNGSNSGHVRVYRFNGEGWIQVGQNLNGESPFDYFGNSVSLSGDGTRVAIGAPQYQYENNTKGGYVRIFQLEGGGQWRIIGSNIDGVAGGDECGYSVALSDGGSTVAIGAPGHGGGIASAGQVRVYELMGG